MKSFAKLCHNHCGNDFLRVHKARGKMKKNIKAALLSAFVFPGLGQIYKGRKLKGGILLLLVNILLLSILVIILHGLSRLDMTAAIPNIPDSSRIAKQLLAGNPAITWAFGALSCVWLYAVLDALLSNGNDHSC
jgi:TM2 domain-containing membrane protein YozV